MGQPREAGDGSQGVAATLVVHQPAVDESVDGVGEAGGVEVVDAAAEAYAVQQQAGVGVGGAEGVAGAG
ncbi:MAG: hypothetical protein V9E94_20370 [Microthrixaceae bacterium]